MPRSTAARRAEEGEREVDAFDLAEPVLLLCPPEAGE